MPALTSCACSARWTIAIGTWIVARSGRSTSRASRGRFRRAARAPSSAPRLTVAYRSSGAALANLLVNQENHRSASRSTSSRRLLPRDQLGAIISIALKKGDKFTEAHSLEAVPLLARGRAHPARPHIWSASSTRRTPSASGDIGSRLRASARSRPTRGGRQSPTSPRGPLAVGGQDRRGRGLRSAKTRRREMRSGRRDQQCEARLRLRRSAS